LDDAPGTRLSSAPKHSTRWTGTGGALLANSRRVAPWRPGFRGPLQVSSPPASGGQRMTKISGYSRRFVGHALACPGERSSPVGQVRGTAGHGPAHKLTHVLPRQDVRCGINFEYSASPSRCCRRRLWRKAETAPSLSTGFRHGRPRSN